MPAAVARRREGLEHEVELRQHRLIVDEPQHRGGGDAGPTPTELIAAALASCTAITIEMYADRKEWELGRVECSADYGEPSKDGSPSFTVSITVPAALSEEQLERLKAIAGKCPVHRTLTAKDVGITDTIETTAAA
jgi:putative redox protein